MNRVSTKPGAVQTNARVILGEVTRIDVRERRIRLTQASVAYDVLVLATGARHHYSGTTIGKHSL